MRNFALAGAAAALVVGVSAAPQAIDVKVKSTTSTTVQTITKYKTETDIAVTTTVATHYVTQTRQSVTTVTSYSTVTTPATIIPTVTVTASCTPVTITTTKTVGTTSSSSISATTPATTSSSSTSATTTATTLTTTELAQQANPTAISTFGLADYAKKVDRYFGTAVDYPGTGEGSDPVYLAVATNPHEFNQWTPANIMKYEFTEPQQGVFDFSGGDSFIALAKSSGIPIIRCHNLLWHQELPNWLTQGNWTRSTLLPIMYNHIEQLITHFGDNCTHWDVVNEALSDSPTASNPWRTNIWNTAIGPDYVQLAFQKAAQVVTNQSLAVKLYYNDYSIEWPGDKTTNAATLVRNLTAAGVRIDGVGMQSHFTIGGTPSIATMNQTITTYTSQTNSIGKAVEVALTELDVRGTLPVSDAQQIQQFNDYRTAVGGCVANAGCVGMTLWDFDDTYSWVPSTFAGQGWATPWFRPANSSSLVKKLAYDGIIDGLTGTTTL